MRKGFSPFSSRKMAISSKIWATSCLSREQFSFQIEPFTFDFLKPAFFCVGIIFSVSFEMRGECDGGDVFSCIKFDDGEVFKRGAFTKIEDFLVPTIPFLMLVGMFRMGRSHDIVGELKSIGGVSAAHELQGGGGRLAIVQGLAAGGIIFFAVAGAKRAIWFHRCQQYQNLAYRGNVG